jgi:hypothetical protein
MLKLGLLIDESLINTLQNQLMGVGGGEVSGDCIEPKDIKKQTTSQRGAIHTSAYERSLIFKTASSLCSLFYNAKNISDYTASNIRTTDE